jgi:RNA polymerase sigma factor (sigma-70 family)
MQPNLIDLLACRAISGDRRAADRLVKLVLENCAPAINKYRRYFGENAEAESAAGIAFTIALRDWQPWGGPFSSYFAQSFKGYAQRAARDRFRRTRRVNALQSAVNDADFAETQHAATEATIDRTTILNRAAAALDGRQAAVFEAVRNGEQQTEIAARLGVSVQNVNQILARALDRVRTALAIEIRQGA